MKTLLTICLLSISFFTGFSLSNPWSFSLNSEALNRDGTSSGNPQRFDGYQDEKILSSNHAIARNALNEAILRKDFEKTRLGLKSSMLSIRSMAADALSTSGQTKYVVDLADALEANRSMIGGGTEIQIEQRNLNITLIRAIESLTHLAFGLDFGPQSAEENPREFFEILRNRTKPSEQEIAKVVEETRKWWSKKERLRGKP